MNTAAGSPRRRAIVSSSVVVLRTAPSRWSTSTRIWDIGASPGTSTAASGGSARSDELGAARNSTSCGAAVALVGDDLPVLARRPGGHRIARRSRPPTGPPRRAEMPRSARVRVVHRLLLRRHDPLERRVARLVDVVGHADHSRQRWPRSPRRWCRRRARSAHRRRPRRSTDSANVTCGTPSRSASIAGTTPSAPSVEAMPVSTRSYSSVRDRGGQHRARWPARHDPCRASSSTCTPASAPICSDLADRVGRRLRAHGERR